MATLDARYLGNGVYASFDGERIWLKTGDGSYITLNPATYAALVAYHDDLSRTVAPKFFHKEPSQ